MEPSWVRTFNFAVSAASCQMEGERSCWFLVARCWFEQHKSRLLQLASKALPLPADIWFLRFDIWFLRFNKWCLRLDILKIIQYSICTMFWAFAKLPDRVICRCASDASGYSVNNHREECSEISVKADRSITAGQGGSFRDERCASYATANNRRRGRPRFISRVFQPLGVWQFLAL